MKKVLLFTCIYMLYGPNKLECLSLASFSSLISLHYWANFKQRSKWDVVTMAPNFSSCITKHGWMPQCLFRLRRINMVCCKCSKEYFFLCKRHGCLDKTKSNVIFCVLKTSLFILGQTYGEMAFNCCYYQISCGVWY